MGPRAKMQMEGYLREQIRKDTEIFNAVTGEAGKEKIDGSDVKIKTGDPESQIDISLNGDQATATFTYALDNDKDKLNGRLYLDDRFVFDPKGEKLIDVKRSFRMGAGTIGSVHWNDLYERLKKLEAGAPLASQDPVVAKFFKNVVLKVPQPSEDSVSSPPPAPPPIPRPDSTSLLGNVTVIRPLAPAMSLEQAHFHRLTTVLSIGGSFLSPGSETDFLFRQGLGALSQQTEFVEKAPGGFAELLKTTKKGSDFHAYIQGLASLSEGNLVEARREFLFLRDRHPQANFLLKWMDDYETARKNLEVVALMRGVASEQMGQDLTAQKAWVNRFGSLFTGSGEKVKAEAETLAKIFGQLENKIKAGEADTVNQALSQLEKNGSDTEKALIAKIQSESFAGGALADLRKVGGLQGPLQDGLLLTVAREKLVPMKYGSARAAYQLVADRGGEGAEAARKGLALVSGNGSHAEEMDLLVHHFTDELASPLVVASLLVGSTAFHFGEVAALSRWSALEVSTTRYFAMSLRIPSNVLATGAGVLAEAPAFELANRTFNGAFVGADNQGSFTKGVFRNMLTFGVLRGTGVGVKMGMDKIPEASLPFGKATYPIVNHTASFASLHAMNELERALNLRPTEGSYGNRFMSDGVFYLQMGLAGHLVQGMTGSGLHNTIQDLHKAHDFTARMTVAESGEDDPTARISSPRSTDPGRTSEPDRGTDPGGTSQPPREASFSQAPDSATRPTLVVDGAQRVSGGVRPPMDSLLDPDRPTAASMDPELVKASIQIGELSSQLEGIKEKLEVETVEEALARISTLQARVRQLEASPSQTADQAAADGARETVPPKTDPELVKARTDIDRLTVQLREANAKAEKVAGLEARVAELERLLSEANGQKAAAEESHKEAAARVTALEGELATKGEELAAAVEAAGEAHAAAYEGLRQQAERAIGQWRARVETLQADLGRISKLRTDDMDESIVRERRLQGQLSESESKARRLSDKVVPLQVERDEIRRTAEEKERELVDLRGKIEQAEEKLKEIDVLKRTLGEATTERDHAQVLLRAARKDVDRINGYRLKAIEARKRSNQQYLSTIDELRREIRQKDKTNGDLQRDNEFLSNDRDQEKRRADLEKARADGLSDRVTELEGQVRDLGVDLEKAREAAALAERRFEARKALLESEQQVKDRLRAEIDRLKGVIEKASELVKAKDERIGELNAKIRELEEMEDVTMEAESEEETRLKAEVARLEEEKKALARDAADSQSLMEMRDRQFQGALVRIGSLQRQIGRAEEAQKVRAQEYSDLLGRFNGLSFEVGALRGVEKRNADLQGRLTRQIEENGRLRERIQEANGQVTAANEEIGRLNEQLEFARGEVALAEGELGEKKGELAEANQAFEAKKAELKTANEELVKIRSDQKAMEATNEHLRRREAYLGPLVDRLTAQKGDLWQRARDRQAEAEGFQRQATQAAARVRELESQLENAETAKGQAEFQKGLAERRVKDLEEQNRGVLAARKETVEAHDRVQREKRDLVGRVDKLQPLADRTTEAEAKATELDRQIKELQADVRRAEKGAAEWERKANEASQSHEELLAQFVENERLLEEANARLIELEDELRVRKEAEEEAGERTQQNIVIPNETQDRWEESDASVQRLETELREANAEVTRLKGELETSEEARRRLEEARGRRPTPAYPSPMADATRTVDQAQRAMEQAQGKAQEAERLLAEERTKAAGLKETLETQWRAAVQGLQQEIDEKAAAIERLQNILAARGPAFFENMDPRVGKVETLLKTSKSLTNKTGQIIGKAEIVAGGAESSQESPSHLALDDGSFLSAKTTIAVPKKGQRNNEDAVYMAHFTLPNGVEVKVIAGADGAGGHESGDVAASAFLQGVHARVSEKAYQGEIPEAKELFEQGRRAVDQQVYHPDRPNSKEATGAGSVVVIVGNSAMIATAADSLVVLSRRQADGTYKSEGYSNADNIPPRGDLQGFITNGIHIKRPKNSDGDGLEDNQDPYEYSREPNLYGVKDLRPGDRFTIGSDGFYNNVLGKDYVEFGSKEYQYSRGQRSCLLQQRFQLLNLMLEATARRDDAADHFHDWALGNMQTPGTLFKLNHRPAEAVFPANKNKDNIFNISYEHGNQGKNGAPRLPVDYNPLEKIYDVPPPPLKKYETASQGEYGGLIGRYLDPLKSLYGPKVGEQVARTLANLYRNFPGLEPKFNPSLLAMAPDNKAMIALFDGLKRELEAHPEMKSGDNKRFIDAVQEDMKKIREASRPFDKATDDEASLIYNKYHNHLHELFGLNAIKAAQPFADLYKNFPKIEENFNPQQLAGLEADARKKLIRRTMAGFHTDNARPTDHEIMKNGFQALNEINQLNDEGRKIFMTPGGAPPGGAPPGGGIPSWDLEGDKAYVVGRKAPADIVINDTEISSQHVKIYKHEGRWYVEDVGSRNGTKVNKKKIRQKTPVELPSGVSSIKMGDTELMFVAKQGGGATLTESVATHARKQASQPPPPADGAPPPPGAAPGQSFRFQKAVDENYILGSVLINDPSLSKMHAGFRFNGLKWVVRDLGTMNGTWLDSQSIHKPEPQNGHRREEGDWYEVENGSTLTMGRVYVRLNIDEESGDLLLQRIFPGETEAAPGGPNGTPPATAALDPSVEGNVIRMNNSQMMEIGRAKQTPGVYKTRTPGAHFFVIEKSGIRDLLEPKKTYATIMRQQTQFVIANSGVETLAIHSNSGITELKLKQQSLLNPGDWIVIGERSWQFFPY